MKPPPTAPCRRLAPPGLAGGMLALLLVLTGCQTYQEQTWQFNQATRHGSLASAVAQIDRQADASKGGRDEILYRLEQGATLRAAGMADPADVPPPPTAAPAEGAKADAMAAYTADQVHAFYYRRAIAAFDQAELKVNDWEERARVKLGAEVGAFLTNQASLPYRGRSYDKVMMNTYKALSYLGLGEPDKARVELNRSLQRQRDAVAANQERIAAAREEAELARKGELMNEAGKSAPYDAQKALRDPYTGPALEAALAASIAPLQAYGDYVNPFAVFLDGLFYTILGEDGSDWERGRKSFERLAGLMPENPHVTADLAAATLAAAGQAPEGVTYVIFETGTAPSRDQLRIDIPTFLVSSRLGYVGAAFPTLVYHDNYVPTLGVVAGGQTRRTATIASMDSVIANDFKNEWPSVVTKTLISTATKAIVQATLQREMDDRGDWLSLVGSAIVTVTNVSTNIADTRTWTSLPKEFQYARLPTPGNRQLTLTAGAHQKTLTLEPGSINVVYVKSASPTAPLYVSQFVLK